MPQPLWKLPFKKLYSIIRSSPIKNGGISKGLDDYSFFLSPDFKPFVDGFEQFVKERIMESNECYNPVSLKTCTTYDAYMVGSDQTWGEARTRKNPIYFLDCINPDYPKLSYAPSIGTTHISDDYMQVLETKLSSFKSLSCREKTNCGLLSKKLHREVRYVLDPTLLLSAEEWNKVAQKHMEIGLKEKQYILCYILGEKSYISEFAEKLSEEKGMPVYYIVTRPIYLKKKNHLFTTPYSFVSLIRDAAYVITDSFHGTIFSINFNTQFYSFTKREESENVDNDRIIELLKTFGLEERFQEGKYAFVKDINWNEANKRLSEEREHSMEYLGETLSLIR